MGMRCLPSNVFLCSERSKSHSIIVLSCRHDKPFYDFVQPVLFGTHSVAGTRSSQAHDKFGRAEREIPNNGSLKIK